MKTFVELLEDLGVPLVRHGESGKVTEGWVGILCPFCRHVSGGDENLLGISLRTGAVSCWYCGPHRWGDTVAALAGVALPEALSMLRGVARPHFAPDKAPRGTLSKPAGCGELLPAHRNYLRGRGFDPEELVRLWGIQAVGQSWEYAWRLVIPITLRGEVVSWTTRAVGKVPLGARYRAAPPGREAVRGKSLLYGMDYARQSVVACEGHPDVWAVGPGAVATGGTGYTRAQLLALSRIPRRAVCFDAEPEAQARARRLCDDLSCFCGLTVNVELECGADAGELVKTRAGRRELGRIRTLVLGG
jgi:hypothetical protein